MAITQEQNQAWARSAGYTGEFGSGGFEAFKAANPTVASAYDAWRAPLDSNYKPVAQAAPIPVTQLMGQNAQNPDLPNGASLAPVLQTVNANELQNFTPVAAPAAATASTTAAPTLAPTATGAATTVDPNAATAGINPADATYKAATVSDKTPQATAAQGTVNPNATVQGQLTNLYSQMQNGQTPAWAQGAVNTANDAAASRGLGTSTIGTTALEQAVAQSALPIAAQDASTYFQMDLTNLSNQQQTSLANLQVRQQSLLSDQSAENAASQFNASSQSQVKQFMATLVSNIMTQNADRTQAMSQFNAGQQNQASATQAQLDLSTGQFNSTQLNAIEQFNKNLTFQRDQFNATNQLAIDQSNVLWRRAVNTANTASINAANQVNVQNKYNMSQTAQNNLWQQFRDEASWMFQSSENEKTRQYNIAMAANNRTFLQDQNDPNYANLAANAAGAFAASLFK